MARTLKPLSLSFSDEMIEQIEARALSLGLSRSAYLRQLVNQDLEESGSERSNKGKSTFPERFHELESKVELLQKQVAVLQKTTAKDVSTPTKRKRSRKKTPSTPTREDPEGRVMTVQGDLEEDQN